MKRDSQQQYSGQRAGIERIIPTVSSLFLVKLRMSADLNVLKALGITKSVLHDMGVRELRILSGLCQDATSIVASESARRGLTGKKT